MIFTAKKENGELKINNLKSYQAIIDSLRDNEIIELEIKKESSNRTNKQNKAIHLYCSHLSKALNSEGLDVRVVVSPGVSMMWTPYLVKELLWKATQKTMFGKESTKQLKKMEEIDKIYDVINLTIGQRTGIYIPFPSLEENI